jgi:DNA helicase IV
VTTTAFNLPEHLVAKADPALIAGDEQHLAAVAESLELQIADLSERLDAQRRAAGGTGRKALDRDLEIHRLTARLRLLRRYRLDLCLGRMVYTDSPEPVYIGRIGLTDSTGRRLMIDWRAPRSRAVLRSDTRQPDGPHKSPQVPLDPRSNQRLLGRGLQP